MWNSIHDEASMKEYIADFAGLFRSRRGMDSGLSWADQWDNSGDPLPPAPKNDNKDKDEKQSVKQKLGQKLRKLFGKKKSEK